MTGWTLIVTAAARAGGRARSISMRKVETLASQFTSQLANLMVLGGGGSLLVC